MNISEANDVATLIRAVHGELSGTPEGRLRVVEAAVRLDERVHKALMVRPGVVLDDIVRFLER
jgi:hypothetical protein